MHLSLKSFFISVILFNVLLAMVILVNLNVLTTHSMKVKDLERNQHLMIQKADELRQSSDDLTRFVRTYAVTLDEVYKKHYFTILDMRNGKCDKPKDYDRIYWDLLEPLRSQTHPLVKKSALKDEMHSLPYTTKEIQYLIHSEALSNTLVHLEIEAFNAIKGVYKDKEGNYTVHKESNQALAIVLLHSKAYHKAKESIMFPINEFLTSIHERTEKEIDLANAEITARINTIYLMFILDICILLFSSVLISIKILKTY
ncbi:MAG: hypothetical protein Q9M36_02490 [Sulfurovum sp.]|nr:hypothetical protein [Sulfurovum sp.]